jgi:CheY-like chemotaxis protein
VGLVTGSPPNPELAAALHRLRSTLARLKAELELSSADGYQAAGEQLLEDVRESLLHLAEVEDMIYRRSSVLVVDDDARLAELTARGLRKLGFDARSDSGLATLRPREIVVFDLSLRAGLNADVLANLRAARPIVVTGAADSASRALAGDLDASDYLIKPVELEDLAAAVNRRMEEP